MNSQKKWFLILVIALALVAGWIMTRAEEDATGVDDVTPTQNVEGQGEEPGLGVPEVAPEGSEAQESFDI